MVMDLEGFGLAGGKVRRGLGCVLDFFVLGGERLLDGNGVCREKSVREREIRIVYRWIVWQVIYPFQYIKI